MWIAITLNGVNNHRFLRKLMNCHLPHLPDQNERLIKLCRTEKLEKVLKTIIKTDFVTGIIINELINFKYDNYKSIFQI